MPVMESGEGPEDDHEEWELVHLDNSQGYGWYMVRVPLKMRSRHCVQMRRGCLRVHKYMGKGRRSEVGHAAKEIQKIYEEQRTTVTLTTLGCQEPAMKESHAKHFVSWLGELQDRWSEESKKAHEDVASFDGRKPQEEVEKGKWRIAGPRVR